MRTTRLLTALGLIAGLVSLAGADRNPIIETATVDADHAASKLVHLTGEVDAELARVRGGHNLPAQPVGSGVG